MYSTYIHKNLDHLSMHLNAYYMYSLTIKHRYIDRYIHTHTFPHIPRVTNLEQEKYLPIYTSLQSNSNALFKIFFSWESFSNTSNICSPITSHHIHTYTLCFIKKTGNNHIHTYIHMFNEHAHMHIHT